MRVKAPPVVCTILALEGWPITEKVPSVPRQESQTIDSRGYLDSALMSVRNNLPTRSHWTAPFSSATVGQKQWL